MADSKVSGDVIPSMKTVGFFGGSFDPLHFGHINLALHILESGMVDEVLFCPAYCSPFKTATPPLASGAHRLELIRRVISGIPGFAVTSMEIERNEPSFTVDTLRRLPSDGVQYRLILSQDSASQLSRWKEVDEVLRLAPPIVGLRGACGASSGFAEVKMPLFDISSSEIRERINKKFYCEHLVPRIALDYIREHRLY